MGKFLSKVFSNPVLLVLFTLLFKIPVFFTKHLQEDSFITWCVAKNLSKYGVIGFNGEERISASTTHLYLLVSTFFQQVFGEFFIYPLLIFSCILFAIGSVWLGKILFPQDVLKRGIFVVLLNMAPPSLTASCLGMEYGILFFLYNGLMYYGIFKNRNWAYLVFPILLLWTRIDTVIFLGVFFLADLIIRKKINFIFILGGIIGLVSVVGFNWLYFGELVNHTITAKKIAYKNLTPNNTVKYLLFQWAYYGGLIKKFSLVTFLIFVGFLAFLFYAVSKIIRDRERIPYKTKVILVSVVVFALLKITAFAFLRAYFDWYYWLPRVFLFAAVIYYFLNFVSIRRRMLVPALFLFFSGLYVFQMWQSYAIGYMEETQRMQMVRDIKNYGTDIRKSIILEPAGKIPFYTNLYTYDEVGLVNTRINDEMLKDESYWWINSVNRFKPDFVLTIIRKPGGDQGIYTMTADQEKKFSTDYQLVKSYPIVDLHRNAPQILRWLYNVRPIGQDYYLYKKIGQ